MRLGTGSGRRAGYFYFQRLFAVATLAETGVEVNRGVDLGHADGRLVDHLGGDVFPYYSLALEAVCANLLVQQLRLLEAFPEVGCLRGRHEVVELVARH